MLPTHYTFLRKIQYTLAQPSITTLDTIYTDGVSIQTMVPSNQLSALQKALISGTNGQATLEVGDEVLYAILDGEVIIF